MTKIQSIWLKIKELFRKEDDLKKVNNWTENLNLPKELDGLSKTINSIGDHQTAFQKIGFVLGEKGVNKSNYYQICKSKAEEWYQFIRIKNGSRLEGAEEDLKQCQEKLASCKQSIIYNINLIKNLSSEREWNSKDFSLRDGVFFAAIGIILIITDIPMAAQFILNAFELSLPGNKKFLWGERLISTIILLIGFGSLPIFFKYIFDKYLSLSPEKTVGQFYHSTIPAKDGNIVAAPSLTKKIKWVWRIRLGIDISLFIITCITLCLMGILRANQEDIQTLGQLQVLIAIVLPLSGSVLLSFGLSKIHKSRNRSKAEKELTTYKKELNKLQELNKIIIEKVSEYREIDNWINDHNWSHNLNLLFQSKLDSGYTSGLHKHSGNPSLFHWVKELRDKRIKDVQSK